MKTKRNNVERIMHAAKGRASSVRHDGVDAFCRIFIWQESRFLFDFATRYFALPFLPLRARARANRTGLVVLRSEFTFTDKTHNTRKSHVPRMKKFVVR